MAYWPKWRKKQRNVSRSSEQTNVCCTRWFTKSGVADMDLCSPSDYRRCCIIPFNLPLTILLLWVGILCLQMINLAMKMVVSGGDGGSAWWWVGGDGGSAWWWWVVMVGGVGGSDHHLDPNHGLNWNMVLLAFLTVQLTSVSFRLKISYATDFSEHSSWNVKAYKCLWFGM